MEVIQGQKVNRLKQERAKEFRSKMTQEEFLWDKLRNNKLGGFHFRRQQVIDGFIVDFYCCRSRLIIELDGEIHQRTREYDDERDKILKNEGLHIFRIR